MTAETLLKLAKHYESLDAKGRERQSNLKPLYDQYKASLPGSEQVQEPADEKPSTEEEVIEAKPKAGKKK